MIVYTKPNCVQCDATKRKLDKLGVTYEVKSVLEHPEIVEQAREAGYQQAPVVTTEDGQIWGGFQIDLIKKYAAGLDKS